MILLYIMSKSQRELLEIEKIEAKLHCILNQLLDELKTYHININQYDWKTTLKNYELKVFWD